MNPMSIEVLFYILEALIAFVVLGVAFFIWKQTRKNHHQRHAQKLIEDLNAKHLHNIILPDGVDGLVFIDYLLLVPSGFIVLDVEHAEGHLFGGANVDQWSQVLNNKTYKFNNPLYANQQKCHAVAWNIEQHIEKHRAQQSAIKQTQWKTHGWVAFTHAGNFPKGIPNHVSMIDDLSENINNLLGTDQTIDEALNQHWHMLQKLSLQTSAENTEAVQSHG
jgi:Nuclease-related domain